MDPMVIAKAGVDVPPAALIGIPVAVGIVAWLIQRAPPRPPELEVAPA
jgi:hypothetical protein